MNNVTVRHALGHETAQTPRVPAATSGRGDAVGATRFRADLALASLHWPDDVLKQFLFDHGDNGAFVHDYGGLDLRQVRWQLETIPVADFKEMPAGASDASCIESYAKTRGTGSNVALTK